MRQQPLASAHRSGRRRRLLMQRAAVAALALGRRVTRADPQAATACAGCACRSAARVWGTRGSLGHAAAARACRTACRTRGSLGPPPPEAPHARAPPATAAWVPANPAGRARPLAGVASSAVSGVALPPLMHHRGPSRRRRVRSSRARLRRGGPAVVFSGHTHGHTQVSAPSILGLGFGKIGALA